MNKLRPEQNMLVLRAENDSKPQKVEVKRRAPRPSNIPSDEVLARVATEHREAQRQADYALYARMAQQQAMQYQPYGGLGSMAARGAAQQYVPSGLAAVLAGIG